MVGASLCHCPLSDLSRLTSSSPKQVDTPCPLGDLPLCGLHGTHTIFRLDFPERLPSLWKETQNTDSSPLAALWVKYLSSVTRAITAVKILKTVFTSVLIAQYFPLCKRFSAGCVWLLRALCAAGITNVKEMLVHAAGSPIRSSPLPISGLSSNTQ